MTAKNIEKTRARALQALVKDETGREPGYQLCLGLVQKHAGIRGQCGSDEEFLCRVFDAEEAALRASGERKERG